jgi:metal-responsive CopG/Arc/MetJ family transcriptional regulator
MPTTKRVRRSVSLPAPIAKQVDRLAKSQRLSDNRVLVELIELGIEARKQKEKAFFELAGRFRSTSDPKEAKRLGEEMGLMAFKNLMTKYRGKLSFAGCDE